jgi:hypothetical protein
MDKTVNVIAQFIPIVIIFLLLSFSKPFTVFSHSVLGKVFAMLIIVFYTYLDKVLGLFICAIVLLYYQSDFFENMLNIDDVLDDMHDYDTVGPESIDSIDDGMYLNNHQRRRERMTVSKIGAIDKFREDNCIRVQMQGGNQGCGKLMYKDMKVRSDYAEHVFPELEFKNGPCNPCNKSCDISIIESKLKTEIEMIPISSK